MGFMSEDLTYDAAFPAVATMVLKLGYRGADFSGFAEQEGQRTVAGELRRALETRLRRPVDMTCAGRTDAGVHALSQFVSLPISETELALPVRGLHASLAALTPDDISIREILVGPASFSARFDAVSRSYRYRIACGHARPIMAWEHAWWLRSVPQLDVASMEEAAQVLVGEHDFRSFCKGSSAAMLLADGRSTSRFLEGVQVRATEEAGEDLVVVDVAGNAFLHNMVRIIVGTLVEVGMGRRDAAWVRAALEACDRRAAGRTAPARGLTFAGVAYPDGLLRPW